MSCDRTDTQAPLHRIWNGTIPRLGFRSANTVACILFSLPKAKLILIEVISSFTPEMHEPTVLPPRRATQEIYDPAN
jgi:hypothetical protein